MTAAAAAAAGPPPPAAATAASVAPTATPCVSRSFLCVSLGDRVRTWVPLRKPACRPRLPPATLTASCRPAGVGNKRTRRRWARAVSVPIAVPRFVQLLACLHPACKFFMPVPAPVLPSPFHCLQDGAQLFESYGRFHFCFIPLCKTGTARRFYRCAGCGAMYPA